MESGSTLQSAPKQLGRYAIYGELGSGGMATVHFGRLRGPSGFTRPVAVKRLHEHFARDREFVDMFVEEAHLASCIQHVNVVPTLDVIAAEDELWLVMEYVNGESLASLLDANQRKPLPVDIAAALITGVLHGLQAAHETRGELGELLGIVHRDVSPDNILVGIDGVPRLADFGVAKARGRVRTTPAGQVKGKLAYMPCEQLRGKQVDRRADVYGAGTLLWEMLTGRMLFDGDNEGAVIARVLVDTVRPPSELNPEVSAQLDRIVLRAVAREPDDRFASAREMAAAIEGALRVASQSEVADWLQHLAGSALEARAARLRAMVEAEPLRESAQLVPQAAGSADASNGERPRSSTRLTTGLAPGGHEAASESPHEDGSSAPEPSSPRKRPPAAQIWVWLALLCLGLLLWLGLSRHRPPRAEPRPASVETPAREPARIEAPAAPAPAPAPSTEVASAEPVLEPAASEPATREPARSAPERPTERKPRSRKARKQPAQEVDCSSPYYLDAQGIRHVKRECL